MNTTTTSQSEQRITLFLIFKYIIYLLLIRNIYLFYVDESAAIAVMHADGYPLSQFINVYAATIDTFNWVVLLLLFELETWVIPDDKLTAPIKLSFTVLRAICYLWIIYAVFGYFTTYLELGDWQALAASAGNLCNNLGQEFMFSLERFETITESNCNSLAETNQFLVNNSNLIVDTQHFRIAWMMAIADVVNAADWLLVVVILEIEVWLQTQGKLKDGLIGSVQVTKIILYAILVVVAVFWGFYGLFIDFWDAFLWIVAFMFIENNVLQWNKESREEQQASTT